MSERGARAPFYAPPRRKTSAEIISEARAAICAEMKGGSGGAAGGAGGAGGLRALRTRRPYTPREPQRTLFTERTRTRAPRPPSAFDLKYLSLSEDNEDTTTVPDEHPGSDMLLAESQINARQKPAVPAARNHTRPSIERCGEGWAGLPKLPHLSGRSKPLHRRNTSTTLADGALSPESDNKRKYFAAGKSLSCDSGAAAALGDVAVKHLAVQLPTASHDNNYENMSLLELGEALGARGCAADAERTLALLAAVARAAARGAAGARGGAALRDHVLRALYTHVDSDDERVLVAVARAMFIMRVTGSHLAAACKLIFKIAKNDKNDHFFKDSDLLELLVEGCGRAEPVSEGAACVWGAGALRLLALEPRLCALAHRAGAAHLAALHLNILNNAKAERPRDVSEQATHALYQLTGALRSLAGGAGEHARAFVASGALSALVAALDTHTDRDVLTNVARCLSVVSVEESCCAWLCASDSAARVLLRALAACAARAPLAVRLAYTLGNMAAADHQARMNIYNESGGVDVLLTILESYTTRGDCEHRDAEADPDFHLVGNDLGESDGSNEDVLIKTVRVVANLCLSAAAGRALAGEHAERTARALLACLHLADRLHDKVSETGRSAAAQGSWSERREELAAAALATLNNVTFYMEAPSAPLDEILDDVCRATCRWVSGAAGGGGSAACEAVRALGNLTRSARVAQRAVLEGALDALPSFQRHEEESVRCAAAGVLVNVCGAGGAAGAAGAAARALRAAAAAGDAPSAALLARALWNAHAHRPLLPADAHQAAGALASFIDDESVFAACEVAGVAGGAGAARVAAARRASDPQMQKHHVKFDLDNNNYPTETEAEYENHESQPVARAYSVEDGLHEGAGGVRGEGGGGEDLGFEDGELEECECAPCRRLAAWEELVAIAIPLMEKLRPARADASVGTD